MVRSRFPNHSFPSPAQSPGILDLQMHFRNNEFCPIWYLLFDFNLLVYLESSHVFQMEELRSVIAYIIQQQDLPDVVTEKIQRRLRS
jgi:hypothetical protein